MDAQRFDALARTLAPGSRRGLLGVLLTLPVLGGLLTILGVDDNAEAKGRRKRRKKRHKHGKGNGRNRKRRRRKKCRRKSRAKICANRCGIVKNRNTCKKKINCGACACDPPCPACFACETGAASPATCVPDPAQVGEGCGNPGQVCQADGACACDASSCRNPSPVCVEGGCTTCSPSAPCATGCCAGDGSCQPGTTNETCGADGELCQTCAGEFVCQEGNCTCSGCVDVGGQCQAGASPQACGVDGKPCQACGATELCDAGCQPCDVCAENCDNESIIAAIADADNGDTIRICAGLYQEAVTIEIDKNLTLLGAGAEQTILFGGDVVRVLTIATGNTVTLQDLRVVGGNVSGDGGGIDNGGDLTLRAVAVTDNTADQGGGIFNEQGGIVTLEDGSRIAGNTATDSGGGIFNRSTLTLKAGSVVGGDTADDANTAVFAGGIANDGLLTLEGGSQVTGNSATDRGGGIVNSPEGTLTLEDGSQVTGNTATNDGGGIDNFGDAVTVPANTFVCDNLPTGSQCFGDFTGPCPNPGETCPG